MLFMIIRTLNPSHFIVLYLIGSNSSRVVHTKFSMLGETLITIEHGQLQQQHNNINTHIHTSPQYYIRQPHDPLELVH